MSGVEGALRSALRQELEAVGFVSTESKLYRPAPGVVPRSALVDRVRATNGDVITVTAPAGYGKSTFMAELVAVDQRPVAWISLGATDNDPATLLTYIALALDDTDTVDPRGVSAFWTRSPTIGTAALQQFGAMIADRRRPFVLVLDDVHELVSREVVDILPLLVAAIPSGSSIVLGSRTAVPLPLGRLRVRRRLIEVGPAELAFDALDAAILFSHLDLDVPAEETARLVERTEGWPVAVYLAALTHRARRGPVTDIVGAFGGDHRYLAEYLGEELLGGLDTDMSRFLMEASCLPRVSGRVCDDVLQRSGSADLLEVLGRRSLLVIPLDDRREWYRFHHLTSEFLQSELARRDPARRVTLHLRASDWYQASGDADGAITHAVLGGDLPRAESLVLHWFGRMVASGRFQTIERWIAMFTDEELAGFPGLMVVAAHIRFGGGQPGAALQWLARADGALPERHPERGSVTAMQIAVARALIAPMSPVEMAAEARYSYEHAALGEGYPLSCLIRGAAAFMLGDEPEAMVRLREAAESTLHRPIVEATALAHLAIIDVEHGRWEEATASARRARALVGDAAAVPTSALVLAVNVLAETHAGRADDVEADRSSCRRNLGDLVNVAPWLNLQARIALARAALIRGNRVEAVALLNEADAILETAPGAVHVAEQLAVVRRTLATRDTSHGHGPSSLTTAELRVLRLLPSHLSVAEIAERLYVSRNTVKSQTIAIYRKLGTSSRGGAVAIAVAGGLLDAAARVG